MYEDVIKETTNELAKLTVNIQQLQETIILESYLKCFSKQKMLRILLWKCQNRDDLGFKAI